MRKQLSFPRAIHLRALGLIVPVLEVEPRVRFARLPSIVLEKHYTSERGYKVPPTLLPCGNDRRTEMDIQPLMKHRCSPELYISVKKR